LGVQTADQAWIKKHKKAEGARGKSAHEGALIHDGPFLSIRQLHLELKPPPPGQGRYFLVTFKQPVRVQKVRTRLMETFGEMAGLKNETS